MRQMVLEMLHGLHQLGGISIRGGEGRLKWEGDDIQHVGIKNWRARRSAFILVHGCTNSCQYHAPELHPIGLPTALRN